MLGIGKNKGGVALALRLRNTRLCFVNSHLAAHQDKVIQRNQDVRNILRNTRLGSTMCDLGPTLPQTLTLTLTLTRPEPEPELELEPEPEP